MTVWGEGRFKTNFKNKVKGVGQSLP